MVRDFFNGEPSGQCVFYRIRNDTRDHYRQYFIEKLEIANMKSRNPYKSNEIDKLLELILDVVCSNKEKICILGEIRSMDHVKSRFMELTADHLEYVLHSTFKNSNLIRNLKRYMIATLYNSTLTVDNHSRSLVKHSMTSELNP